MPQTSIKVLLADGSEIVRRSIRQVLSTHSEIELVGEAADFAQTIQMARDFDPRVVVLDLHLPYEKKVTLQEVRSQLNQGVQVLAISIWNDTESKELAGSLGAAVLLDNVANALVSTIAELSGEGSSVQN